MGALKVAFILITALFLAFVICIMSEAYAYCVLIVPTIIILIVQLIKALKKERANIIGGTNLDRFFVECVLAEVNDFKSPKNKQRAQLIADKYGLKYPKGIEQLYQQGLKAHQSVSQFLADVGIEAKREEEARAFHRLNQYSELIGKEKRIAMLRNQAFILERSAKRQDNYANMLLSSTQQKEHDWALWGGVASGLGGFGAGVATATDMQLKNMQIRAENEARLKAAMPAYMSVTGSARENRKNAEVIWKEIDGIKLKLMSDASSDELMKKISFSNTDVVVSETGAAMVCTLASSPSKFKILGDVPAVIDGTIIAKIYDGDILCGTAQLVLPVYGLGQNIPLNGICTDCCKPGKTYSVKFVAKHLWAMEA